MTFEGVLFTPPSVCSRLPSALKNMNSTSFHSIATMRYWKRKKTNATFGIDEKGLVQVALLQIHGGGRCILVTASRKSDRSFIGAFSA